MQNNKNTVTYFRFIFYIHFKMLADMSIRKMIRKRRRLQNTIENKINGVTNGVVTVYRSRAAPEFTFVFCFLFFRFFFVEGFVLFIVYSLDFGVLFCSSLLVLLSFFVMVISVLRRFTSSDYYLVFSNFSCQIHVVHILRH